MDGNLEQRVNVQHGSFDRIHCVAGLVKSDGGKISSLAAAAQPSVLCDETSRLEGKDLDRFALASRGIQLLDLGIVRATREIDEAILLGTNKRTELPVSCKCVRNEQSAVRMISMGHLRWRYRRTIVLSRLRQDKILGRVVTIATAVEISNLISHSGMDIPNMVARGGCGEDGVHGIVVNGHDADEVASKAEVMPPSRILRSGSMRSSLGEEIGRSILSGRDLEW